MFRSAVLVVVLLAMVGSVSAQINFSERIIDGDFDGAYSVFAFDIDNDGDLDVLGAGVNGISWWENEGEREFTRHNLESELHVSSSVSAVDLDGDNDIDILGAGGEWVVWYENDGDQQFTEYIVSEDFRYARSVQAVDLDGDDDLDLLGAAESGIVTWWENDGEQQFSEHVVANDFIQAQSAVAADLDGDGDLDIVGGTDDHHYGNTWWENDGEQRFSEHELGNEAGARSVAVLDFDGDDDMDVIGGSFFGGITWHENDGEQEFTEHRIEDRFRPAMSVFVIDIDNDEDLDILGTGNGSVWCENDGDQNFTIHILETDRLRDSWSIFVTDLDDDGDVDMLEARGGRDGSLIWWENDLTDSLRWQVLPDTVFAEDESVQLDFEYLRENIISLQFPDSTFDISVENGTYLFGETNDEGVIITATHNWYGSDRLTLIVTEPDGSSDSTYQRITVAPVNDPPDAFDLVSPDDGASVDMFERVTLSWNQSVDPDRSQDVHYMVRLIINSWRHPDDSDTLDVVTVDTTYLARFVNPLVYNYWWVYAISGSDTTESTSHRSIYVHGGGSVDTDESTVTEFQLFPTYPNPFNSQFRFDFSLPQPDIVQFGLYDITGRQVWSMAERFSVGVHRQSVDLNLNSAGVYFLQAESSVGKSVQRVVMLK